MGRVVNWIYGLVLIYLAIDAMFLSIIPQDMLPIAVVIMGVLILFTPTTYAVIIRRWIFGVALVLLGFTSSQLLGNYKWLWAYGVDTWVGQAILILIGLIYFFAGTKQGAYKIGTV